MKYPSTLIVSLAALTVIPFLAARAQQSAAGFTIQVTATFDYPGTGNNTRPQKINDRGDIIGFYEDTSSVTRAFTLIGGRFSAPLVDPADNGSDTEGRGINNSRVGCGLYLNTLPTPNFHGFFLNGRTFTNYDVPGAVTTQVLGINNAGDFCGGTTPSTVAEGFVNIGGVVTQFGVSGATATYTYQLNDSDQSCGYYADSTLIDHGYYRDADGTIHAPVDPRGSTGTLLFGNNNANTIVGRYTDSAAVSHAFVFFPPSRFLVYDYPGATFTSFNGINARNQIVGRYIDTAGIEHGLTAQLMRGGGSAEFLPLAAAGETVAVPAARSAAGGPEF